MAGASLAKTPPRTPERTAYLEKLAEEHNGFMFGEVPPPPGESRKIETWEYIYIPGMTLAFVLYGVAYWYRPPSPADRARLEALKRIEAKKAAEE
eukprot:6181691-Pleurochrysis_carterae.AAC.1